jgi:transcriptional regulator with GAF, ATPase, and Fis domain
MSFLHLLSDESPQTHKLRKKTIVGRSDDCNIILKAEMISRQHFQVVQRDNRFCIQDLDSQGGTFVNDERVREKLLDDGDRITVGPYVLQFSESETPPSSSETEGVAEDLPADLSSNLRIENSVDSRKPVKLGSIVPPKKQKRVPERFEVLCDVKDRLNRLCHNSTPNELCSLTLESIFPHLGGDQGSILLRDEEAGENEIVSATTRKKTSRPHPFLIPRGFQQLVTEEKQAILIHDAPRDKRLQGSRSTIQQGIRSAIVAPLLVDEEFIGFMEVDSRKEPGLYDRYDLYFLSDVAQSLSTSLANSKAYRSLKKQVEMQHERLIGQSPPFRQALQSAQQAAQIAQREIVILLLGEEGTGKTALAEWIHNWGPRSEGPFVHINCAGFQPTLLESELFGHKKGAFTDARESHEGLIEAARGGTLFLDEIGDLAQGVQGKLLILMDSWEFRPVGSTAKRQADVRIIASTNQDLEAQVKTGRFRRDLYDRLDGWKIRLPSLCERRDDIRLLASHFVEKHCRKEGKPRLHIREDAMQSLSDYRWPGNVRELENVVRRAVIRCTGRAIQPGHILLEGSSGTSCDPRDMGYHDAVNAFCKWLLEKTLAECSSHREAAKRLGLNETYLAKLIKKFDIKPCP